MAIWTSLRRRVTKRIFVKGFRAASVQPFAVRLELDPPAGPSRLRDGETLGPSANCNPRARGAVDRLTLVIGSLGGGGAERVLSAMANYWAARGRSVTLITLSSARDDWYVLDKRVRRVALAEARRSGAWPRAVLRNLRRIWRLRGAIRASDPDVVVSFIDTANVLTLWATRTLNRPVIVSERIDPRVHEISRWWNWLRELSYPWAAGIVVQTESASRWAEARFDPRRVTVIPNSVPHPRVDASEPLRIPKPYVAAVGRLEPQKGFDLLLRAAAMAFREFPEWSLAIIGEGPERTRLEALVTQLDLSGRVQFVGRHPDPARMLNHADLFVLSSRYEGFPNVLCEAMATGLPVVAFDCPSGPRDIVRHGVDGLLVPPRDSVALAQAMTRLMGDAALRRQFSSRAVEVLDRFGQERVMRLWDQLLTSIKKRPRESTF